MKKNIFQLFSLLIFTLGVMLSLQSCNKCKNVDCQNNGTCDKGVCTCPSGFTGDNCELCNGKTCQNGGTCAGGTCNCPSGYFGDDCAISCTTCSQFAGNYSSFKQYCNSTSQYTCTLSIVTTASNKLSITNFNNKGWTVSADVSGNSFTIAAQTFTDSGTGQSWKVETTSAATLSGSTLTIPVKFTDTSTLNTVTCASFLLFKQ